MKNAQHKGGCKKKTHEEYLAELEARFPHIIPRQNYVDAKTKIRHECLICGNLWDGNPNSVLTSVVGCPNCAKKQKGLAHTVSHDDALFRLKTNNPSIQMIGKYKNISTHTDFLCLDCGCIWSATPDNVCSGRTGCPQCGVEKSRRLKFKTKESYLEKLSKVNPNVKLIEDYVDRETKVFHKCMICGYVWKIKPANALSGRGCPKCGHEKTRLSKIKTHEQFLNEVKTSISPNVKIVGKYISCFEKIECECLLCNTIFYALPSKLKEGLWHYECMMEEIRQSKMLTLDEFYKRLFIDVELVSEYKGYNVNVDCKCNKCQRVFTSTPHLLLLGYGCSYCSTKSVGETIVQDYLDEHDIDYVAQKRFKDLRGVGNKLLSYDFYLPQYKLLIEYNGEQHYKPIELYGGKLKFEEQLEHDKRKQAYADCHGLDLLSIRYDEISYIHNILDIVLKSKSVETVIET